VEIAGDQRDAEILLDVDRRRLEPRNECGALA
jgi:hypothetical protein